MPDSSSTYTISYRTCLCKWVNNKVIYCTRNWQCRKGPWSRTKLEPSVSRQRHTSDFTTSVHSSRDYNIENMHELIFKWETATDNEILLAPKTNNFSNWAEKTHYSVIIGKYYLEDLHQAEVQLSFNKCIIELNDNGILALQSEFWKYYNWRAFATISTSCILYMISQMVQ